MANPPPPYDDITGISRTVMKDNAQETLSNYNGNARPGEIVADLTQDPPTLYVGNNLGQLTLISSGGGNSTYGNSNVSSYLSAGSIGNIIPSGNAVYSLGNATNQWSDLYVSNSTIYIGGIALSTQANTLLVAGQPVLSNNGSNSISTSGNITGGVGTFSNLSTAGNVIAGGNVVATGNITGGNITTVGNVNSGAMYVDGNVVITGNANVQGNLTYNNITNLTTANLVLGLGNNQTGINVTGGGIAIGNTNEATLLYNYAANSWISNINLSVAGNVTGDYFIGDGSQLTNVVALAGTEIVNGTSNASINSANGNINLTVGGTQIATVASDGFYSNTENAFIAGSAAISSVALQLPYESAIRNYYNGVNNMYFDVSIGGTANGAFQFRTTSSYTNLATISNTGLAVSSTQTDSNNVGNTVYFNSSTKQFTTAPTMAAFSGFQAPFSGNITSAYMGQWIQASNNVTLPNPATVPAGTVWSIYSLGTPSITVSVHNPSTEFIYAPPQFTTSTTSLTLFQGQWIQILSRGGTEWDIIASNLQEAQKISKYVNSNAALSLDTLSVRYSGQRLQFSLNASNSSCGGQTLELFSGSGPVAYTIPYTSYTVGTWTNIMGANFVVQGDSAQAYLAIVSGSFIRNYRIIGQYLSSTEALISIERLVG